MTTPRIQELNQLIQANAADLDRAGSMFAHYRTGGMDVVRDWPKGAAFINERGAEHVEVCFTILSTLESIVLRLKPREHLGLTRDAPLTLAKQAETAMEMLNMHFPNLPPQVTNALGLSYFHNNR